MLMGYFQWQRFGKQIEHLLCADVFMRSESVLTLLESKITRHYDLLLMKGSVSSFIDCRIRTYLFQPTFRWICQPLRASVFIN